jgi:hypothetical protein
MATGKGKRKCQQGITTIRVPIHLHKVITKSGEKLGLNNYEVIQKMADTFIPLFCPELTRFLGNK